MSLHFGNIPILVLSSADVSREITKTYDLTFINRPKLSFFQILLYDYKDIHEYWRQMRSICVLNLLSNKRVQFFRAIIEEETALVLENVQKSSSFGFLENLSKLFSMTTNNIIGRIALVRKYSEDTSKFKKLLREYTELLSTSDVGDYLPWVAWVSHVNGFKAES
ncbi:Detected protein of confused Function [Hibiscus syriacus]|uniref:Detected protein of confused Function n=1 Tax=Hibiscus syriacus TaxID=106335 RepID=A0A6A3BM90_HIBSY|nr:Detected protein of confused Function [Hibiscus syriacus]